MGGGHSKPKLVYTEAVHNPEAAGESPVYRKPGAPVDLHSIHPSGAKTIIDNFEGAVRKFGDCACLGTRQIKSNGEAGPYQFKTYSHVAYLVNKLADSLINIVPRGESGLAVLGLYSVNREEWVVTDLACASQDIATVPLYDTLGWDNIDYIINQTEMTCVAASLKQTPTLLELKKQSRLPTLTHIIHFEALSVAEKRTLEQESGIKFLWYVDLINEGAGDGKKQKPHGESIYTICYTSGTTGQCKGVIISNANMVVSISAALVEFQFTQHDCHISYLPMAHIMERIVFSVMISCGVSIGFFAGNVMKLKDDLAVLRPTVFISVPRLFSRLHDAIKAQFETKTGIARKLVQKALAAKEAAFHGSLVIKSWLWDLLVFRKVRQSIGGRVRLMLSGSAPITNELVSFVKIAFVCPVLEGYGQTESCGASIVTSVEDNGCGYVGGPLCCLEIKIVSIPEMRYLVTDTDEQGRATPRGELCLRGPQVFHGYFKQPEKTAEVLDADGWVHTGDIVIRLPENGAIKLIDRKKNIFKLAQGEYVAVEKIENVYTGCPYVNQIFVYGDSFKAFLVAVVVPNEAYVRHNWCKANGIDEKATFEELCSLPALKAEILKSMMKVADERKVSD